MSYCETTGKWSFGSEAAAKKAARNLANQGRAGYSRDRLHAYRCGHHFHIGHYFNRDAVIDPRKSQKRARR